MLKLLKVRMVCEYPIYLSVGKLIKYNFAECEGFAFKYICTKAQKPIPAKQPFSDNTVVGGQGHLTTFVLLLLFTIYIIHQADLSGKLSYPAG